MSHREIKNKINPFIKAAILLIIVTACSKEGYPPDAKPDPELIRRDSITALLKKDMNSDTIKSYVVWLQNFGTRFALADNHKRVAQSIMQKFIELGLTDTHLDSFQISTEWWGHAYNVWQYNVVAHLHGSVQPDSLTVIGAHYDDIVSSGDPFASAPGADDNASGVAATLEIARVMVKNHFTPRGSINFVAFAAEELGLLGSQSYADKEVIRGDKIIMMINNDMISYESDANQVKWQVNIIAYPWAISLLDEAIYCCSRYLQISPVNDNTNYKRSDSYSFYQKGIKAVYFAARNTNPNYHTLNDIQDNSNFLYCRSVAQLSCAMLLSKN